MPIPLGAALIGGGSLAAGAAQSLAGAIKGPAEREQEERRRKLQALLDRGAGGLSAKEQALGEQQLLDPVRGALASLRRRNEQQQASSGTSSGAALARGRREEASAAGQAIQGAGTQLLAADVAKERAQRAELSQLDAARQASNQAGTQQAMSGLGSIASGIGTIAGSIPESTRISGVAGAPIRDPELLRQRLIDLDVAPDVQEIIMGIPPGQVTMLMKKIDMGDLSDPRAAALHAALQADALSRRPLQTGALPGGALSGDYNLSSGLGFKG